MRWVFKVGSEFKYQFGSTKPASDAQKLPKELWYENPAWLVASELDGVYTVTLDQGTKDAALAEQQAQLDALNAFKQLNKDIELDAAQTSGTTNQISALMDYLTYLRMKANPELFDQEGLVAKQDVGTFSQGDALNDALKVQQYAEAMLAQSESFMIRRMKAITDYIIGG